MAIRLVLVACCILLLVGCGPESGADSGQIETEVERIAAEYANNGDISRALTQIEALEVANPKQWALLLTERYIAEGQNADSIASLVKLMDALGLDSAAVTAYAEANDLLAAPEIAADPIVVVVTPLPAPETGSASGKPSNGTTNDAVDATDADAERSDAETTNGEEDSEGDGAEESAADVLLPTPTNTPESGPKVRADAALNVRRGPGLLYDIVGGLQPGDELDVIAKNDAADWWQVTMPGDLLGWVYGPLVQTSGDVNSVAVAANIPAPPEPTPAPAEPAPAPEPESPAEEEAPPPSDKPHFTLVKKRLWDKAENGGCAGQHLLRIHVLDANGNRLNGVALSNHYPPYETIVTGSQGKGDGIIEYDITDDGPGFSVIRDNDGREATSDRAEGFTARSRNIAEDLLINANYCGGPGLSSCAIFYESFGCNGHHSWDAEFRRNY